MIEEQVRRRLPDLATGEINPLQAWGLRQRIRNSPELQREWQELTELYADVHRISQASLSTPAPDWAATTAKQGEEPIEEPVRMDWAQGPTGRRRFVLPAIAATAILTLCYLPLTGWLVRGQLFSLTGQGLVALRHPQTREEQRAHWVETASRNRNNFDVQLGVAILDAEYLGTDSSSGKEERAWTALQRLLPGPEDRRPALYAYLLNAAPWKGAKTSEVDENTNTTANRTKSSKPEAKNDPQLLRQCIEYAEAGRKIDPENAYFPLMCAYFLLASDRPAEAMESVREAGRKPVFEDYMGEAVEAKWALLQAAEGEVGIIPRMTVSAGTLFSFNTRIRSVARLTRTRFLDLESKGKRQEGFALRVALLNVAQKLQGKGQHIIGGYVGNAIGAVAINRPGGEPAVEPQLQGRPRGSVTEEENRQYQELLQTRFDIYAKQMGHPEVSAQARDVYEWMEKTRREVDFANVPDDMGTGFPGTRSYLFLMAATYIVLFSAIWTLLFHALFSLLARTERIVRGQRLHYGVAQGLALIPTTPALLAGIAMLDTPYGAILMPFGFVLMGLILHLHVRNRNFVGVAIEPRQSGPMAKTLYVAPLLTIVVAFGMLLIGALTMLGPITFLQTITNWLSPSSSDASGPNVEYNRFVQPILFCLCLSFAGLIPTALALIVLAIKSFRRRLPASVGMVRGFRWVGLPMASVLLLIYAATVTCLAVRDAEMRDMLRQSVQDEYGFYSGLKKTEATRH